jgi:hypothetical protein
MTQAHGATVKAGIVASSGQSRYQNQFCGALLLTLAELLVPGALGRLLVKQTYIRVSFILRPNSDDDKMRTDP